MVAVLLMGCAPAIPIWGGVTPEGRGDVAIGGAVRVGFGGMSPDAADTGAAARYVRDVQAGGVAPAAAGRYGVAPHTDIGLTVAGPLGRLDVRHELVLSDAIVRLALAFGAGPYAGYVDGDAGGEAARLGVDVPVMLTIDVLSLVSVWVGARAGVEHGFGTLVLDGGAPESASATGVRVGGVLGLSFGFKNVHALLELTAAYERWDGSIGASPVAVEGFVLTPAFALRYRL